MVSFLATSIQHRLTPNTHNKFFKGEKKLKNKIGKESEHFPTENMQIDTKHTILNIISH